MNRQDQLVPNLPAFARTRSSAISSVLNITLTANTTMVEVHAEAQGVFLRLAADCTNSNFDEYIQAGQTRHYHVAPGQAISVLEAAPTATVTVIEKSI